MRRSPRSICLITLLAFFSLSLILSTTAVAAPVYVVDIQKVLESSIAGKAAQNNLSEEAKKNEAKLRALSGEVKKLREDFDKQKAVLSTDALKSKAESIDMKEKELQRNIQDAREALGKQRGEALAKLIDEIKKTINELAEKKGYEFVVERDPRFVIYANNNLDITESVVQALDAKKLKL